MEQIDLKSYYMGYLQAMEDFLEGYRAYVEDFDLVRLFESTQFLLPIVGLLYNSTKIMRQNEIARSTGINKALVSKFFNNQESDIQRLFIIISLNQSKHISLSHQGRECYERYLIKSGMMRQINDTFRNDRELVSDIDAVKAFLTKGGTKPTSSSELLTSNGFYGGLRKQHVIPAVIDIKVEQYVNNEFSSLLEKSNG